MKLTRRPRRLRRTAQIRNLVHEVDVRCDDLIYPVFVTEGENLHHRLNLCREFTIILWTDWLFI